MKHIKTKWLPFDAKEHARRIDLAKRRQQAEDEGWDREYEQRQADYQSMQYQAERLSHYARYGGQRPSWL